VKALLDSPWQRVPFARLEGVLEDRILPANNVTFPQARSAAHFFKGQLWQALAFLLLVTVSYAFAAPALGDGSWLGIEDKAWYWAAVALALFHQLCVWVVWRWQLGWAGFTRLFGRADMVAWAVLFIPLLLARPVLLFGLSVSDLGSMDLPRWVQITTGIALLIPAVYTLWSAGRYFDLKRALGGDHFRLEYRAMPMVDQGAFRWSGNAMYAYVFLGLWAIAFLTGSLAALSLALFQHAFVWAHYYCTEKPDMGLIYGAGSQQTAG
jgi:hypothetical protein